MRSCMWPARVSRPACSVRRGAVATLVAAIGAIATCAAATIASAATSGIAAAIASSLAASALAGALGAGAALHIHSAILALALIKLDLIGHQVTRIQRLGSLQLLPVHKLLLL